MCVCGIFSSFCFCFLSLKFSVFIYFLLLLYVFVYPFQSKVAIALLIFVCCVNILMRRKCSSYCCVMWFLKEVIGCSSRDMWLTTARCRVKLKAVKWNLRGSMSMNVRCVFDSAGFDPIEEHYLQWKLEWII